LETIKVFGTTPSFHGEQRGTHESTGIMQDATNSAATHKRLGSTNFSQSEHVIRETEVERIAMTSPRGRSRSRDFELFERLASLASWADPTRIAIIPLIGKLGGGRTTTK
jgi:hypothetical protein